jgi:hypothetical protein
MANIVNNFPKAWNRNEENAGHCEFRFSIQGHARPVDPAAVARFGWEMVTDPAYKNTFLRTLPAETSYVRTTSGTVLLTAFGSRGTPGEYFMRLVNVDPIQGGRVRIASEFLNRFRIRNAGAQASGTDFITSEKGAFHIQLNANECATVLLEDERRNPAVK